MTISDWLTNNWIEIFGALSGIIYVFLEIRQNFWLWPVGIVTSAVYILVFFTSKLYADMSLQCYYLGISVIGWYWWMKGAGNKAQGEEYMAQGEEQRDQGTGRRAQGSRFSEKEESVGRGERVSEVLRVTRLKFKTGMVLAGSFAIIYLLIWLFLIKLTDSPVPRWDAFITSLSVIATWMLARKIYEHWYLWLIVNSVSVLLFIIKGLYPTVILYMIYFLMSFAGLKEWKKSMNKDSSHELT